MLIGELSQRTGVSTRMLRYYEQEGLLAPRRAANGYRVYDDGDVELVANLRCLHELGLDLHSSAALARRGCGLEAPPDSPDRHEVVRVIDEQLATIAARRRELADMTATLTELRAQLTEDTAVRDVAS